MNAISFSLFLCAFGLSVCSTTAFLSFIHRCGNSPVVNNAQLSYDDEAGLGGYNVTYTCDSGYHLVSTSDTIECVCTSFFSCHFRGNLPVCKKDPPCFKLPHPPNGQISYDGHTTAHYSCNKDYVLIGHITRHCDENGQWDGPEPKCDPVPRHQKLRCRACERVKHLDQCQRVITCRDDEECYTEHIINDVTRMAVFTSGCRRKQDCSIPTNITSGSDVVNCSECCADLNATLGCNSDLCSFREKSDSNSTYCVKCEMEHSIKECNNITACDSTQMCVSSTVISGTDVKVSAGCYSAKTCQKLMKALIDSENARDITLDNKRNIIHTCDMCCGDDGCNDDTCENVKERIAYLYQRGELDLETLRVNGTSPIF